MRLEVFMDQYTEPSGGVDKHQQQRRRYHGDKNAPIYESDSEVEAKTPPVSVFMPQNV